MRFSSPSFSSRFTNSRKSAYATVFSRLGELYHERLSVLVNVERQSGALADVARSRDSTAQTSFKSHNESQRFQADTNCLKVTRNVSARHPYDFTGMPCRSKQQRHNDLLAPPNLSSVPRLRAIGHTIAPSLEGARRLPVNRVASPKNPGMIR